MAHTQRRRADVRYRPARARGWFVVLVAAAIAIWRLLAGGPALEGPPPPLAQGEHQVRRVIDGDTLRLADGARLRLQGIDAPELGRDGAPSEPFARKATEFAERFVESAGMRVRLTFTDERLDKYDRYLAFVWRGDECLNELLVREGLAEARLDYRFTGTMRSRLRDAQQEARRAGRGMWAER